MESTSGRILAWNGSREAARATHDIERTSANIRHPPAQERASAIRPLKMNVGEVILSAAADYNADLLVIGAYGHSRLRETVLGGVTRHVLSHMSVPVLMSH